MATKLKNMQLTSVDLVRAGANQDAKICLYKSDHVPDESNVGESNEEIYKNAIIKSIQSIVLDENLTAEEKSDMVEKSIGQYCNGLFRAANTTLDRPSGQKMKIERNENTMKIDKSIFTAEELEQYEALIAKAKVEPEEKEMKADKTPFKQKFNERDDTKDDIPDETEDDLDEEYEEDEEMGKSRCKKKTDSLLKAAMSRLEALEKSIEMKELTEVAKRYAPLGENESDLAKTLYEMKQSGDETYEAYLGILEKSMNIVEKSGIFSEIGKSASGAPGGVIGKIEAVATEIQKSDATMTREQAIAKAWENHPELIAEYDAEYRK